VGIRRVWQALQLVQIVGLSVASLSASTGIVAGTTTPDAIAANFKNAVKAQYTADQWRPSAQSVFDPLRRKKRDALVSYLVNALSLENSNQLFEYFLVDPGMEPVVQTSRLRLALSSVQTFVQRCLLNLENANNSQPARNVSPTAIRADWWEWMKRYRVWEVNREIFLFPENWMEPELRLDKTDLFQALESDLLQGDVTRDLVEDAFLTYLKGLDVRARLDIVASYLDQDLTNPGISTLHVLGRTYGHPHKYFYRTYSTGTWSGWQAVTPDIESDHIALAIWRGRLNLFWLTFISKAQAPAPPPASAGPGTKVTDLGFNELSRGAFAAKPQKQVQIQLHWSEYVQGKWTNRISTDVNKSVPVNVLDDFDPRNVHIHVSKETDSSGNEGAVKIHADFPELGFLYSLFNQEAQGFLGNPVVYETFLGLAASYAPFASRSFRVTSKNCDPDLSAQYWEAAPPQPYDTTGVDATFYTGNSNLSSSFQTKILAGGSSTPASEKILNAVNNFELLTCANPVAPPFLKVEPLYQEAGGLVSPFFFKDTTNPGAGSQSAFLDERTFFVQPNLTETTVDEWQFWALGPATPTVNWANSTILNSINVVAQVPTAGVPINPPDPVYSVYAMQNLTDWATSPTIAISYGGASIGKAGGIQGGSLNTVGGGGIGATGFGGAIASAAAGQFAAGNIAVVGKQGLSLSQVQTVRTTQLSSPGANVTTLSQPGKS
jgi:hypothetical protein